MKRILSLVMISSFVLIGTASADTHYFNFLNAQDATSRAFGDLKDPDHTKNVHEIVITADHRNKLSRVLPPSFQDEPRGKRSLHIVGLGGRVLRLSCEVVNPGDTETSVCKITFLRDFAQEDEVRADYKDTSRSLRGMDNGDASLLASSISTTNWDRGQSVTFYGGDVNVLAEFLPETTPVVNNNPNPNGPDWHNGWHHDHGTPNRKWQWMAKGPDGTTVDLECGVYQRGTPDLVTCTISLQ